MFEGPNRSSKPPIAALTEIPSGSTTLFSNELTRALPERKTPTEPGSLLWIRQFSMIAMRSPGLPGLSTRSPPVTPPLNPSTRTCRKTVPG
jgi:hypothetical protein